jgi:hypothetical protein
MNENLLKFLTQATIMIVSVSASTTQGYRFISFIWKIIFKNFFFFIGQI